MIRLGRLRHIGLRTRAAIDARMHPPGGEPACNICGCKLRGEEALWSQREVPSCHVCKSTLRFRSLMAALQLRLHDRPEVALAGAAPDKGITGLTYSPICTPCCARVEPWFLPSPTPWMGKPPNTSLAFMTSRSLAGKAAAS